MIQSPLEGHLGAARMDGSDRLLIRRSVGKVSKTSPLRSSHSAMSVGSSVLYASRRGVYETARIGAAFANAVPVHNRVIAQLAINRLRLVLVLSTAGAHDWLHALFAWVGSTSRASHIPGRRARKRARKATALASVARRRG